MGNEVRYTPGTNVPASANLGWALDRIAELRYDYIHFDGDIANINDEKFEMILKLVERTGTKVYSVHAPFFLPRFGESVERIIPRHRRTLKRAMALGALCVTHHPGQFEDSQRTSFSIWRPSSKNMVDGRIEKWNYEVLALISEEVEKCAITPSIENLGRGFGGNFTLSAERLSRIVDDFDEKLVVCFDSGHTNLSDFDPQICSSK